MNWLRATLLRWVTTPLSVASVAALLRSAAMSRLGVSRLKLVPTRHLVRSLPAEESRNRSWFESSTSPSYSPAVSSASTRMPPRMAEARDSRLSPRSPTTRVALTWRCSSVSRR